MLREEIKTLQLKNESLTDKVEMQENFIDELEQQGKGRIDDNYLKVKTLNIEVDTHLERNELIQGDVDELLKEQER